VLRIDGVRVRLGPVLRVLTLALFCARGALVPSARLAGILAEPGRGPASGGNVRSHISHLRKAFGDTTRQGQEPKVLVSGTIAGSAGYGLRLEAIDTDVSRFEQEIDEGQAELREGRYAVAAGLLRGALSRWRGEPLSDAAGRPFARDWIEHLEDRHRQVIIARVAADIGAAEHMAVTSELERLARWWPDDEVIGTLRAIALYRSGRPKGAADVCEAAIRAAQSHGLDSPRLHGLQRDVLNGTLPEVGLPHSPWQH
jgi:DNA-binding SARP family transcriptional activator